MTKPNQEAAVSDRRSTLRVPDDRPMNLSIEGVVFEGRSRDISEASVFFLADSELRMSVSFDGEGGERRHGHLVRYQRMPGGGSGWAIEFDE